MRQTTKQPFQTVLGEGSDDNQMDVSEQLCRRTDDNSMLRSARLTRV